MKKYISVVRNLSMVSVLSAMLAACNNAGGSSTSLSPPQTVENSMSQTATTTVNIHGFTLEPYQYIYSEINSNDSNSPDNWDTSSNLTGNESSVSVFTTVDTNKSWGFGIMIYGIDLSDITSDTGCPYTQWSNPNFDGGKIQTVTASLQCVAYSPTQPQTYCSLYSGNGEKAWRMDTPPYSNPSAIFYVSQTGAGKYKVSCDYNWWGTTMAGKKIRSTL